MCRTSRPSLVESDRRGRPQVTRRAREPVLALGRTARTGLPAGRCRCSMLRVPGLISLSDIHKHYGPHAILDGVTLDLQRDHRVAVIGRNGAGKSTLCRIIIGEEEPDAGAVVRHEDLRLSWLEQQAPFQSGETAEGFLERWSGQPSWECARLAARFQIGNQLLETKVELLSGGLQTRLRLSGMLLEAFPTSWCSTSPITSRPAHPCCCSRNLVSWRCVLPHRLARPRLPQAHLPPDPRGRRRARDLLQWPLGGLLRPPGGQPRPGRAPQQRGRGQAARAEE